VEFGGEIQRNFRMNVFRGYPEYMTLFPICSSPSGEPYRLTHRTPEKRLEV